jgi:hypothetical protein
MRYAPGAASECLWRSKRLSAYPAAIPAVAASTVDESNIMLLGEDPSGLRGDVSFWKCSRPLRSGGGARARGGGGLSLLSPTSARCRAAPCWVLAAGKAAATSCWLGFQLLSCRRHTPMSVFPLP